MVGGWRGKDSSAPPALNFLKFVTVLLAFQVDPALQNDDEERTTSAGTSKEADAHPKSTSP